MPNEEMIDYIMQTPENVNPNILRSSFGSGGDSMSGIMVVHESHVYEGKDEKYVLDKTYAEIEEALQNEKLVLVKEDDTLLDGIKYNIITAAYYDTNIYKINLIDSASTDKGYMCLNKEDYPSYFPVIG